MKQFEEFGYIVKVNKRSNKPYTLKKIDQKRYKKRK